MSLLLEVATFTTVLFWGFFLLGLGLTALFAPEVAKRFLLGFAQTARRHFLEMACRMIVGASLLVQAAKLEFSTAVTIFGWILIATTAVLLIVPWRWHRGFADRTVPAAMRYITLIGIAPILLGIFIITLLLRRFI